MARTLFQLKASAARSALLHSIGEPLMDFYLVGPNRTPEDLHGHVLSQLLGIVTTGMALKNNASVFHHQPEIPDPSSQFLFQERLDLFR
jgi:hypothetical protein